MTVKKLREMLENYSDDEVIVINETYIDHNGHLNTHKVATGYITIEKK